MSIRKQNELREFVDDFIQHPYTLKKSTFDNACYIHRKGKCFLCITIHWDHYEIEVGHYWDINISLDYPFTYDSRMDSWSENRRIKLPAKTYALLLEKVRKQMMKFMPKILPNKGWRALDTHLKQQKKQEAEEVCAESMEYTLTKEIRELAAQIKVTMNCSNLSIETEHHLETLLTDLRDLFNLLENVRHMSENRLQVLIGEGLQVARAKYKKITERVAQHEENSIKRKVYLIQER